MVLLRPAPDAVAAPRIIEFQLPSDTLTLLIWDRLYTDEICSLDPFPFPLPSGSPTVLDRVVFPERPTIVLDDGSVSMVVRVDVYLRPEECLTRPCAPNEYVGLIGPSGGALELEITYALDLETDLAELEATLCMNLDTLRDTGTDVAFPASILPPEISEALTSLDCPTFSLAAFTNILANGSHLTDSGLSALPDGSRLAMRFEVDGPESDSATSWEDFANGALAPTDGALAWSLFVDARILEDKVRTEIDHEMTCKENPSDPSCYRDFDDDGIPCRDGDPDDPKCNPDPKFIRTDGPTVSWSGGGADGGGHLHVELEGDVPGGCCEPTICPNSIHVDPVEIDVDLRIEASDPGWLKRRLLIDPDPDDDDVFLCGFLIGSPGGPLGITTALVVGGVIADLFDPSQSDLGLPGNCDDVTSPDCNAYCISIDDDEYDCAERLEFDVPLDFGGPTFGEFHLTKIVGLDEGAVLGGALDRVARAIAMSPPDPFTPRQRLRVDNGQITYGIQGGCSNLHLGFSGSFRVRGDGSLCEPIAILDDPPEGHANEVGVYFIVWPGADPHGSNYIGNQKVEIRFPVTSNQAAIDAFFLDPYPLRVLVRTSAGLRVYEIPAPIPAPDPGSPGDFSAQSDLVKAHAECIARRWKLKLPQKLLDVLWLIDPPPFLVQVSVEYVGTPPDREFPLASLRSLSVSATEVVDAQPAAAALGMLFERVPLRLEGTVLVNLQSFGQHTLAFDLERLQTLFVSGFQEDLQAELTPSSRTIFSLDMPPRGLPNGIRSVHVEFVLNPDDLAFHTTLLRTAGPADFDEDGDVDLGDWMIMQRGFSGAGRPTKFRETDFDGDRDTDLGDILAYQGWFTGAK